MAKKKRGRPKGSKTKPKEEEFVIPKNARIIYEVWFKDKMYGYTEKQYLPGIVTLLFSVDGNFEKAKKIDRSGYLKQLKTRNPRSSKKTPLYITRSY